MNPIRFLFGGMALGGMLLGLAAPLGAEEVRPVLSAPLILHMLALPMERPEAAFRESLRAVPAAPAGGEWEMLPDGSARLGNSKFQIIIKNPCPDGTIHAPVALPGRR